MENYIDQLNSVIVDVNKIVKFFVAYIGVLTLLSWIIISAISNQVEKAKQEILNQIKNNQK